MTSKKDALEMKERVKEMKKELERREEEEKRARIEGDKNREELGAIKEEVKAFEGKVKKCVEGVMRGRRGNGGKAKENDGELKRRGSVQEDEEKNDPEEIVLEKPLGREELEEVRIIEPSPILARYIRQPYSLLAVTAHGECPKGQDFA